MILEEMIWLECESLKRRHHSYTSSVYSQASNFPWVYMNPTSDR